MNQIANFDVIVILMLVLTQNNRANLILTVTRVEKDSFVLRLESK